MNIYFNALMMHQSVKAHKNDSTWRLLESCDHMLLCINSTT